MRTLVFCCLIAAVSAITGLSRAADLQPAHDERLDVIARYMKASYARDYRSAYGYIAERDQRVWDKESYARRNGSLSGFALALAQTLAAGMQVWTVTRQLGSDRARYEVAYRAPTADELSSALFDWDERKLGSLSNAQQQKLMARMEALGRSSNPVIMNGRESFDLIRHNGQWKIFNNWAAANKVKLKLAYAANPAIDGRLSSDDFVIKPSVPFDVSFSLRNAGARPVSVRLIHSVEPRSVENKLEMISCGALAPITLEPGAWQEITMAYILSPGLPPGQAIHLGYEIRPEAGPFKTTYNPRRSNHAPETIFVTQ
jgi:hypothetical protein